MCTAPVCQGQQIGRTQLRAALVLVVGNALSRAQETRHDKCTPNGPNRGGRCLLSQRWMTTRSIIFGGGVKKLPKVRHGVQDTLVGSAPPARQCQAAAIRNLHIPPVERPQHN